MTDKPTPKDEPGAQERFERGLKNALATARKPHKPQSMADDKHKGARRPK